MEKRIILRNNANLSFAGEVKSVWMDGEEGVLLKPSEKSRLCIWCPREEVKMIVLPDSRECSWEEMRNELGF